MARTRVVAVEGGRGAHRLWVPASQPRGAMASYAGEHSGARGVRFSDVSWGVMTDAPLLTITDAAREKILDARAGEPDGDALALWFDVSGVEGNSFTYDMYFSPAD